MIKKLFQNLLEKAKTESWLSSPDKVFYYLLILFLPTQFGRHFWPEFSFINGVRIDYLSPTLYLTDIFIFLIFIFWLIKNKKKKIDLSISRHKILICLILILGVILSKNPSAGVYGILKITEFAFVAYYVSKIFNKEILEKTIYLLSFGVLLESVTALLQFFQKHSLGGIFYFFGERAFNAQTPNIANASLNGELVLRPYGTFSHPNVLAAFLLISIVLIVQNFKNIQKEKTKLFFYLCIVLSSIALFLSMSRIAIILYFIFGFYYFAGNTLSKFKKNISARVAIVPGVLLIIAVGVFIFSPLGYRFNLTISDASFIEREKLIAVSLKMVEKYPLTGVGINNFLDSLNGYEISKDNIFYLQPVHNIFFLIFSQTGIIIGIYFLIFLYKTFKNILSFDSVRKKNLILFFLLIITLGSFDHYFLTIQQGQLMFVLLLGIFWQNK